MALGSRAHARLCAVRTGHGIAWVIAQARCNSAPRDEKTTFSRWIDEFLDIAAADDPQITRNAHET
jgi:hypothetical protein